MRWIVDRRAAGAGRCCVGGLLHHAMPDSAATERVKLDADEPALEFLRRRKGGA